MRGTLSSGALTCAMILVLAAPAVAQTSSPKPAPGPAPAPVPPKIGMRAYFLIDTNALSASETFNATMGSSTFSALGGGGEVLNIWSGLFARVAFSSMKESGTRVAVIDGAVVPLGIPLTVEMKPLEIAGGWRFPRRKSPRFTPYGGAGYVKLAYKETSEFASPEEESDESFSGFVGFGGLEVVVWKWIVVGGEVQYRSIAGALGTGGASQAFNETNLGGTTFRFLMGVRR